MTGPLRTVALMAIYSVVSLLLGAVRELAIARDLRASGQADLFFRGLAVVATVRMCSLSVFRARWIPVPSSEPSRSLRGKGRATIAILAAAGAGGVAVLVGPRGLAEPSTWVLMAAAAISAEAGHLRALAERVGREAWGFGVDWGISIGTIVGALMISRAGPLGPSLGLLAGLGVATVALIPIAGRDDGDSGPRAPRTSAGGRPGWLLMDTLLYVNLVLLDSGLAHLLPPGGLAVLNYAGLFMAAPLAIFGAGLTVVGLRTSAHADPAAVRSLRRWAALAAVAAAMLMTGLGLIMGWSPVATALERVAGWNMAERIQPVLLASGPFVGLRLLNLAGRQSLVVGPDIRRLVAWDFAGTVLRVAIVLFFTGTAGIVVFPLAIAAAELVQLAAWWRTPVAAGSLPAH